MCLIYGNIFAKHRDIFEKNSVKSFYEKSHNFFNYLKEETIFLLSDMIQRQKKRINNISTDFLTSPQKFSIESRFFGNENLIPWYSFELSNEDKSLQIFLGNTVFRPKSEKFLQFLQSFSPSITIQVFKILVIGRQTSHSLKNQYCPYILKKIKKFSILQDDREESPHYYFFIPFNSYDTYSQLGVLYDSQKSKLYPIISLFIFKDFFLSLEYRLDKSLIRFSDKHSIFMLCLQKSTHKVMKNNFHKIAIMIRLISLIDYFYNLSDNFPEIFDNCGFIIFNKNSFFHSLEYSFLIFITFQLKNIKITVYFDKHKPVGFSLKAKNKNNFVTKNVLNNKQQMALEKVWFY